MTTAPHLFVRRSAHLQLDVVAGPDAGRRVELDQVVEIGRKDGVALVLNDTRVSRLHVRVTPTESGAIVEDMGSRNGTSVNGRPITAPTPIAPGDTLRLGDSAVLLSLAEATSPSSTPLLGARVKRRSKRRAWTNAVVVVVVMVAAAATVFVAIRDRTKVGDEIAPDGTLRFQVASRRHVTGVVRYPQTPPVGGDHATLLQNCGVYQEPVAVESAVHSLEHGAVWITYRQNLAQDQVERLESLAEGESFVLVSPFDGLPAPIVASAWGRQLHVSRATDHRLREFLAAYIVGPQAPERGTPCFGGTGSPIGTPGPAPPN